MKHAQDAQTYDAIVVGAGFAGMYMLYKLRELGFSVKVIEKGDDVGGTWYWNRYPGARCDVESIEYSYSFDEALQQEWEWSERYATQPEILAYQNHVADRFDLRKDIQFETKVTSTSFDEATQRWTVHTDQGDVYDAKFCIMATGCLSEWRIPNIPGLDDFEGDYAHTATWPHERVDFSTKKVGVIGTGATGIQLIPKLAERAEHVYVYLLDPRYSIPAGNHPLSEEYVRQIKEDYPEIRERARQSAFGIGSYPMGERSVVEMSEEEREELLSAGWEIGGLKFSVDHPTLGVDEEVNNIVSQYVRDRIDEIVDDPTDAEALKPSYPITTKRLAMNTDYFETYNRDNVTLVDLRETPIETITASGIRTSEADYELDFLAFATGFDAMTGALDQIDIAGRDGRKLKDKWKDGPRSYLGLMVAGFPNLFTITGPGSPSVLSNMMTSIEQHVDWIADCITWMDEQGKATIDADEDAEDEWVAHVLEVADQTLFVKASSWYLGANVPGKPRVFAPYVGGVGPYREHCDQIVEQGYTGFEFEAGGSGPKAASLAEASGATPAE